MNVDGMADDAGILNCRSGQDDLQGRGGDGIQLDPDRKACAALESHRSRSLPGRGRFHVASMRLLLAHISVRRSERSEA